MRAVLVAVVALGACKPDVGTPLSLVTTTRVLAVRGTPAEAAPGAMVTLEPLVAGSAGVIAPAELDWAVCHAQKPLTTNNAVADVCLTIGGVDYLGYALPSVQTTVPADACRLFGPDLPPQMPGEPDRRPAQPDATGGYYQPFRADLGDDFTVALERIRCSLRGASMDVALAYAMRYLPNNNPDFDLTAPMEVIAGTSATFIATWPADAAEVYPIFDLATGTLVDHREAMRVSWYATAGSIPDERTGRDSTDPALDASTSWLAPKELGPVHVYAVLRDGRGGVAWRALDVEVVP